MENKFSYGLKTLFIATIILLPYSTYGYVGQDDGGATRALYHFLEKSGTTAGDSSGYIPANNGTFLAVGEPAWNSNGRFGYALNFDGINDYVAVPDATSLDITNAITIEAWVKPAGDGWKYKRPITLSPATSQANYQVRVELTTAIMGNPYANVKANGEDLRFYQADGTSLDYWIEDWNVTGTSTIWVEVATSGESTIYMYYGNSSANSASNGTATFIYFNDFETAVGFDAGALNPTRTVGSAKNGTYGIYGAGASLYKQATRNNINSGRGLIFESWIRSHSGGVRANCSLAGITIAHPHAGTDKNGYQAVIDERGNGSMCIRKDYGHSPKLANSNTPSVSFDTWYFIRFTWTSSGYLEFILLDSNLTELETISATNTDYTDGEYGVGAYNNADWDDYRVRKYTSPEPGASVGNETAAGISKAGAYGIGANTTTAFGSINNQTISASIPSCWTKRKPITITGSTSDLSYHQVKVAVIYDPDMQPDFDDLRFTDADGKFLSYWIESYIASNSATVWVKVPSIPTAGTTIYMYYGNPSTSSASNGIATFEFFDDFEDGNDDGWTEHNGNWSVVNFEGSNRYYQSDNTSTYLRTSNGNSSWTDYILETKINIATGGSTGGFSGVLFRFQGVSNHYAVILDDRIDDSFYIREWIGGAYNVFLEDVSITINRDTWYDLKVSVADEGTDNVTIKVYIDGNYKNEITDTPQNWDSGKIALMMHGTQAYYDDIRVRKYASTEPSATVLSEEDAPSSWTHIALTYSNAKGTMKLYVNGVSSAEQSLAGAISTNTNNLLIGDIIAFNGTIDEVRIVDYVRTAFNAGVIINEVCYWPSGSNLEWIELYNGGNVDISCCNWAFYDDDNNLYQVPSSSIDYTISPGEYIIIWFTDAVSTDNASNWYTINGQTHTLGAGNLGGDNNSGGDRIYMYPNTTTGYQNLIDFIGWGDGGGNDTKADSAGIWDMDASNPYIADNGEEYKVDGEQMYAGATIGLKSDGNYEEGKRDWTAYQFPGTQGSSNSEISTFAVELISFDAVPNAWAVKLIWMTEVEINNSHWIIERAEDEVNYKQIKKIGSRGPVGQTYVYIDKNVDPGITYHYKLGDVEVNGDTTWHGPVKVTPYGKTYKLTLNQPYPNPSIGLVTIGYSVPGHTSNKKVSVNLSVHDIAGRVCKVLVNEEKYPGSYKVLWEPTNLSSGIYFLKLNKSEAKKIFLLK